MPSLPEESFAEEVYKELNGGVSNGYVDQFYSKLAGVSNCSSEEIQKLADETVRAISRKITINPEPRDRGIAQIRKDAVRLSRLIKKRGAEKFSHEVVSRYIKDRAGKKIHTSSDFVRQFAKHKTR